MMNAADHITRDKPMRGEGELRIAIVVDPSLSLGFLANTVAAIGIGLGAETPGLGRVCLADASGFAITNSADRPVPILQADDETMKALLKRADRREAGCELVVFPAFARSLHSFGEYEKVFPEKLLLDEKVDGIGLCGPARWVNSLTGSLKLLR